VGDEIAGLPSTAAVRPTDRELPRREQRGSARRREPGPKKSGPSATPREPDDQATKQVGTKRDVRG